MENQYFINVTIEYLNRVKNLSLPRFTNIEKIIGNILLEFNVNPSSEVAMYSKDWFRFLSDKDNLDRQMIVDGCALEIVNLESY
ncbi:MAG: hypothetical protein LBM27_03025 [Lactobacillaceae bacterium]|jgi:uncharacterized ubiquitin-like protein YukD|nr:hypothetical protein [Lactobacillaceae bacterium]